MLSAILKHRRLIGRRFGRSLAMSVSLCVLISICATAQAQTVVDQIIALVNDQIITRSDLLWSIALDPKAPSPAGSINADILRRKLDVMIDERIVAQEAARIPSTEASQEEIDQRRAELIAQFPSEAAFRQRVESVGLTRAKIEEMLRQRIMIDRFIDFRFRSFVFVSEQELQRYYDERLAPEIRKAGQIPPPFDQVRDNIMDVLKQEKINQEIDKWLEAARQRADIVQLAEL